jgi:glycosyltransferase involved in cell wall biosynthesis
VSAPLITIDVRMFRASGIGTYLRALVPRVMQLLPEVRFCLLGDSTTLASEAFAGDPRVECREFGAGVYSPLEQLTIPRIAPADTSIFWAPNVNVPVVHPGRLLVTVHDAFYFDPPAGVRTRLDKRVYLAALTWRLRRSASAVLCVSEFTKSELERVGNFSCPLRVVRSGIEPDWFSRPNGEQPWPKPYLVYVGNLKPHKNLLRTLVGFARVAERVPHDFLLIGAGNYGPLVSMLDPRIRGRVHFLGSLDDVGVKRYVAHASGLVLASLYEGFGLPPLEAMALGVPVLVSRAASLPEICGDAALYCNPHSVDEIAQGLERLLCDRVARARLERDGPQHARRFNWDDSARGTADVIGEVLEKSRT